MTKAVIFRGNKKLRSTDEIFFPPRNGSVKNTIKMSSSATSGNHVSENTAPLGVYRINKPSVDMLSALHLSMKFNKISRPALDRPKKKKKKILA